MTNGGLNVLSSPSATTCWTGVPPAGGPVVPVAPSVNDDNVYWALPPSGLFLAKRLRACWRPPVVSPEAAATAVVVASEQLRGRGEGDGSAFTLHVSARRREQETAFIERAVFEEHAAADGGGAGQSRIGAQSFGEAQPLAQAIGQAERTGGREGFSAQVEQVDRVAQGSLEGLEEEKVALQADQEGGIRQVAALADENLGVCPGKAGGIERFGLVKVALEGAFAVDTHAHAQGGQVVEGFRALTPQGSA